MEEGALATLHAPRTTPEENDASVLTVPTFNVQSAGGLCKAMAVRQELDDLARKKNKATPPVEIIHVKMEPAWSCGNSSLGNMLSIFFHLRAVALTSGLTLSLGRCPDAKVLSSLQGFLPSVSPASGAKLLLPSSFKPPRGPRGGLLSGLASGRHLCSICGTNLAHTCKVGWPNAPKIVAHDLRRALVAWSRSNSEHTQSWSREPLDEVAVHLRCGVCSCACMRISPAPLDNA